MPLITVARRPPRASRTHGMTRIRSRVENAAAGHARGGVSVPLVRFRIPCSMHPASADLRMAAAFGTCTPVCRVENLAATRRSRGRCQCACRQLTTSLPLSSAVCSLRPDAWRLATRDRGVAAKAHTNGTTSTATMVVVCPANGLPFPLVNVAPPRGPEQNPVLAGQTRPCKRGTRMLSKTAPGARTLVVSGVGLTYMYMCTCAEQAPRARRRRAVTRLATRSGTRGRGWTSRKTSYWIKRACAR